MLWAKERKWGWYLTLIRLPWFCVKILKFNKWGELSLQKHYFRNELWIGLSGGGIFYLGKNQKEVKATKIFVAFSIAHIKKTFLHMFLDTGRKSVILEIQWGRIVSEKDIKRYD